MKTVVVKDCLVSYRDSGKGPVLLCLHGWQSDSSSFNNLAQEFSDYRLIAPDLPNFGNSEDSENITQLDDYANFVEKFISKLELTDYVLVGHSMGGQIAIRAIANHDVHPRKLVLIAASGVRDQKKAAKRSLRLMSKLLKKITPSRLKKYFYRAIGSDYSNDLSNIHKRIIDSMLSSDVQQDAKSLKLHTLLLYGLNDTSTPPSYGKILAANITHSDIKIIDNADHWLHVNQIDAVGAYLKEFISHDSST